MENGWGQSIELLNGLELGAKSMNRKASDETRIESFLGGKRQLSLVWSPFLSFIFYIFLIFVFNFHTSFMEMHFVFCEPDKNKNKHR